MHPGDGSMDGWTKVPVEKEAEGEGSLWVKRTETFGHKSFRTLEEGRGEELK